MAASSGAPPPTRAAVAAFVRVYEPLNAFSAAERAGWRAAAESGEASAAEMAAREHLAALRALCALPPRVVTDSDLTHGDQDAPAVIVLQPPHHDGEVRVCPVELSWRALVAVEEFQSGLPPAVLHAFLPRMLIDEASRQLGRLTWSATSGSTSPHVRTSAWSIPLVWFAAFLPDQRLLTETPAGRARQEPLADADPAASTQASAQASTQAASPDASPDADRSAPSVRSAPMSLRYLAPMADARRCIARALAAVRRNPTELLPAAEIEEFGRWLEEFHARSVVELDYGGLVALVGHDAIGAEDSVGAVHAGLRRVRAQADRARSEAEGTESTETAALLRGVQSRWEAIAAFEHAS